MRTLASVAAAAAGAASVTVVFFHLHFCFFLLLSLFDCCSGTVYASSFLSESLATGCGGGGGGDWNFERGLILLNDKFFWLAFSISFFLSLWFEFFVTGFKTSRNFSVCNWFVIFI